MENNTSKKKGLIRLYFAFCYSINGLRAAFKNEAAFRQEVFLFVLLLPVIYYLPATQALKGLLLVSNTLVLIVELLNSAIEAIVDLASPDFHILAKRAKDMGSAGVLISLFLSLFLWFYAILTITR
jgi:diacylglycerol kinase (ATP)